MRVVLDLDDGDGLAGTVTGPDAVPIVFVGRLGLLAALERIAPARRLIQDPPDPAGASAH